MQQNPFHTEAQELVNLLYRQWSGKMITSLTRYFGLQQIETAEDLVQETFEAAVVSWGQKGVPGQPVSWLFKVCKNKAINWLRKKRFSMLPATEMLNTEEDVRLGELFLDHEINDSQLRMMVACCHPAFSAKNQIIFVLRHVAGLTVREIARGLLMTDEAVSKSIVRSKQLIREKKLTFPEAAAKTLRDKLPELHLILYLLFNEGYAATEGDVMVREEFCAEAIRLMKLIVEKEDTGNTDSLALLSLFLLHTARFPARENTDGNMVDLESQDRTRWDHDLIKLGQQYFVRSTQEKTYSRYQLEAAIAFEHSKASSFETTNWQLIYELYSALVEREPGPATYLNWTIALFFHKGPEVAYAKLCELEQRSLIVQNQYYFSLLGKIYMAMEDTWLAGSCFRQAIELSTSLHEKKYLDRLLASL